MPLRDVLVYPAEAGRSDRRDNSFRGLVGTISIGLLEQAAYGAIVYSLTGDHEASSVLGGLFYFSRLGQYFYGKLFISE